MSRDPASSPGQFRMSRDPLRSVARRVRCPGTTAPPSETTTPTDGLLRSATSAGRPTQLLRGDRRVLSEKKPKVVTSPCKNEEARAQRSAIPTAVLPGQECARGRHTHTPSGRHPLVRNAAEKDASPPRQKCKQRLYCGRRPEGTSRLSRSTGGPQLIRLTTGSGACGREASRRAAKTRSVH